MIVIDRLLASGIGFVLRKVAQAADADRSDESAIREELLSANLKLEQGEITVAEYDAIEAELIHALRQARAMDEGNSPRGALRASEIAVTAVEVDPGIEATRTGRSRPRRRPAPKRAAKGRPR